MSEVVPLTVMKRMIQDGQAADKKWENIIKYDLRCLKQDLEKSRTFLQK